MNVMFSVMLTCGMMIVAGTKRVAPPGSTPIVTKKLGLGATDGPDGVAEATEIAGGTAKIAIRTAITRSAEFLIPGSSYSRSHLETFGHSRKRAFPIYTLCTSPFFLLRNASLRVSFAWVKWLLELHLSYMIKMRR